MSLTFMDPVISSSQFWSKQSQDNTGGGHPGGCLGQVGGWGEVTRMRKETTPRRAWHGLLRRGSRGWHALA